MWFVAKEDTLWGKYFINKRQKFYNMIFSFVLITVPTVIVSFLISKTMDIDKSVGLNIVLFYLYVISSICLIMAGTTDPGIFERQRVKIIINN